MSVVKMRSGAKSMVRILRSIWKRKGYTSGRGWVPRSKGGRNSTGGEKIDGGYHDEFPSGRNRKTGPNITFFFFIQWIMLQTMLLINLGNP